MEVGSDLGNSLIDQVLATLEGRVMKEATNSRDDRYIQKKEKANKAEGEHRCE